MMKIVRNVFVCLAVAGLTAGTAGCAAETIPYPKLSSVKKLKNRILSREEQEEAIRDLSAERAEQESANGKTVEKSP